MGLDMYAYTATKPDSDYETERREIAYWRKHPNLHGWMQQLWESKCGTGEFNGDELELTWEDIDRLEQDIQSGAVAQLDTRGFFFGDPADDYYREQDLDFVKKARAELFLGLRVFYNSSW